MISKTLFQALLFVWLLAGISTVSISAQCGGTDPVQNCDGVLVDDTQRFDVP